MYFVFIAVSLLAVVPRFLREGTNIVTETYRLGTLRFFHHMNPYVLPLVGGDRYEYSPFYCLFYSPFAWLPLKAQALAWALFNAAIFWLGIDRWFKLKARNPWWQWVVLLLCSMELNISLLYQQSNAMLIGLCLLGLADYRDEKWVLSGIILALAAVLKIYPAIFILLLLFPIRPRFIGAAVMTGVVAVLLPAIFIGIKSDVALHAQWLERLFEATNYQREDLDIRSVLARFGFSGLGRWVQMTIGILSLTAGFFYQRFRPDPKGMAPWITLGITALLLINPRSESPTFVFLAPAYLFLAPMIFGLVREKAKWTLAILLFGAGFLITWVFTDAWPKRLWDPGQVRYATKTMGALVLWFISFGWLLREWFIKSCRPSPF
jgi:hypothetical protein